MIGSVVYLLHFEASIGNGRHYIGSTTNLARRTRQHETGRGAKFTRRFAAKGIAFVVARTWEGGMSLEFELKKIGGKRLCPVCSPTRSS